MCSGLIPVILCDRAGAVSLQQLMQVIHPRLKALQLTEIASINTLVFRTVGSPVVIAPDEWITIIPRIPDKAVVIVDGKRIDLLDVQKVDYEIAPEEISFYQYGHHHFWERVNDAFIGDN